MKKGDYLVAKLDGKRDIWNISRDNLGFIMNSDILYSFEFKKGEKFLITEIVNDSVVKIETKNGGVGFTFSEEEKYYEPYTEIFYDFKIWIYVHNFINFSFLCDHLTILVLNLNYLSKYYHYLIITKITLST
jgi:hypothetical protein